MSSAEVDLQDDPNRDALFNDNAAALSQQSVADTFDMSNFDLGDLDLTTEDAIEFDDVAEDLRQLSENTLIKKALDEGVDLREYATKIDRELRDVERASVQDYMQESNNLMQLHTDIEQCDEILKDMEDMLSGFQRDLGNISSEIKHLQDDSLTMSVKLGTSFLVSVSSVCSHCVWLCLAALLPLTATLPHSQLTARPQRSSYLQF